MTIDLAQFAGETIWAAWGRKPEERSQAMKLGATLAMAAENAGYRLAKQEQIGVWCDQFESFFSLSPAPHRACCKPLWRDLS